MCETKIHIYSTSPISISQQIAKLQGRGLIIEDIGEAERFLRNVSYYRLRAYTYPFQDNTQEGEHHFLRDDIRIEDIEKLYLLDGNLRSIIFNAIAFLEVSFRTRIIQTYSEETGNGHWFLDKALYRCKYEELREEIEQELKRSREDFIKHYKTKYNEPSVPPCWMSLEVVSLGTLSRLYYYLKKDKCKKHIAHSYGIADINIFENWIHAISEARNYCAHHARLWNRRFTTSIIFPYNTSLPFLSKKTQRETNANKLFPLISVIKYLLYFIHPSHNLKTILRDILSNPPQLLSLHSMGFPMGWQDDLLWQ